MTEERFYISIILFKSCVRVSSDHNHYQIGKDAHTRECALEKMFLHECRGFLTWETTDIWVNSSIGFVSESILVTITDKRAYHVFKLKGEGWIKHDLDVACNKYSDLKRRAWGNFDKYIAPNDLEDSYV